MLLFLLYIMAALDWLMVFVRKKQQQNDLLKVFHVFSLWPLRNAHTHTIELKKITKKWIQPTLRKWPNHTGIRGRSVKMLIACSNIHMSIWMAAWPSSHQVRQTFNIKLVVALYDVVVIVTAVVFHIHLNQAATIDDRFVVSLLLLHWMRRAVHLHTLLKKTYLYGLDDCSVLLLLFFMDIKSFLKIFFFSKNLY